MNNPMMQNPMQLMQKYQQFRQQFQGNPQQIIQQMMQSGRISQNQLDAAQQMAQQFGNMFHP